MDHTSTPLSHANSATPAATRNCHTHFRPLNQKARFIALLCVALVTLLAVNTSLAAYPIDAEHKWAWATNAGWVNHRTAHGEVTVHATHLEGYAYAENLGWIRLGTHTDGGSHTYGNTDNTNYGVNRTGNQLSGYAWGANIGWINFNPLHSGGGVTIDPNTGDFSGYAWSAQAGWIKFAGTAQDDTTYKVKTDPLNSYRVTIRANPSTGGTATGEDEYVHGTDVTVAATPNEGWKFLNWTENEEGVSTSAEYTFIVDRDRTLTAHFLEIEADTYSVQLAVNPADSGTVSGGGEYSSGTLVTIAATPFEGYFFVDWTEEGEQVSTEAEYSFAVAANRSLTANFQELEADTFNITVFANPVAGGRVSGGGLYQVDREATVRAVAGDDYTFINWTENGREVSQVPQYTFTVTASRFLTANFDLTQTYLPLPDTGQSKCYDTDDEIECPIPGEAFFGQDAQYPRQRRSFSKLGADGEVLANDARHVDEGGEWIMTRDNVTGLVWELKTDANMDERHDWEAARSGVIDGLNDAQFGGFTDWRLPTVDELSSLINSDEVDWSASSSDAAWFPNTAAAPYWSATPLANLATKAWSVNFHRGFVHHEYKTDEYFVRAVRSGQPRTFDDLVIRDDGTFSDPTTGLMWQLETAPGTYTWEDALAYAEGLELADYTDWRLPNRNELQSLVDYSRYVPSVSAPLSRHTLSDTYATSTTAFSNPDLAWLVSFSHGPVFFNHDSFKTHRYHVRAVRIELAKPYTVSVFGNPASGGRVQGGGTFIHGTEARVMAIPNQGWDFLNWSEDGEGVADDAEYIFQVTRDRNLLAQFVESPDNPDDPGTVILSGRVRTDARVGVSNVTMSGLPGDPVTGHDGTFHLEMPREPGRSFLVAPRRNGWSFTPASAQVVLPEAPNNVTIPEFVAAVELLAITGKVVDEEGSGVEGVIIRGLPGPPTTDAQGAFRAQVPWGWSGSLRPRKTGFYFEPAVRPLNRIIQNQADQDFQALQGALISGCIRDMHGYPVMGVRLIGLPEEPVTPQDGCYMDVVPFGWEGVIRPVMPGWSFVPEARSYPQIGADQPNQDYTAQQLLFEWGSEIGLLNLSSESPLQGILRGFSWTGNPVWSAEVALNPGGRLEYDLRVFPEGDQIQYIVFEGQGSSAGYQKFFRPGEYRVGLESALAPAQGGELFVPHVDSSSEWWTGIAVVNTTDHPVTLAVDFADGQGQTTDTREVPLGAGQHNAFLVRSLFDGMAQDEIKSAVIRNARGMVGLELFGGLVSPQLSGISLSETLSRELIYPHIHHDETWWTGIAAYNPQDALARLTLRYYDEDGRVLSPEGEMDVLPRGNLVGLPAGPPLNAPPGSAWLHAQADRDVLGFELFGLMNQQEVAGYNVVGIAARSGVFPKLDKGGWTGIAFVNTTDRTANIRLQAVDNQGFVVADTELALAPFGKRVKVAEALFDLDIDLATYVRYESDRMVAGFQLNGSNDGTLLDAIPALSRSGQRQYYPHIHVGGERVRTEPVFRVVEE